MRHGIRNSAIVMLGALLSVYSTGGLPAGNDLNLADTALELPKAPAPNIMFVTDDSGSMDWEVMTPAQDGLFTGSQPDGSSADGDGGVKHRDADDDGTADCGFSDGTFTGYLYVVEFGSNEYSDGADDCNTADDEAWRIRNSDFNPLYFDPARDYTPWAGEDTNGDAYTDIDIDNAPDNPYNPQEYIDLTKHNSDWSAGAAEGEARNTSDRDDDDNDDGFRFYTWDDEDGDRNFDNGEETEYQIGKVTDTQAAEWGKTAAELKQDFANWFAYYRKREFVAKNSLSKTVDRDTASRIGLATLNNNGSVNTEVALMSNATDKETLLSKISQVNSDGGTPLLDSLDESGRYYECTDGSPFGDTASYTCPLLENGGACQQSYTLVLTDGFYSDTISGIDNADENTAGNDFDGGAFADEQSDTLADIAMHYYKRDLSAGNDGFVDKVIPTEKDKSLYRGSDALEFMHQHMKTYTIGFGVNGSLDSMPPNPDDAFTWWDDDDTTTTNNEIIDDVRHAGYNGRGDYLSAKDPATLQQALDQIFREIGQSEGAASAVAFNTQSIDSGSLVFRAFFNVKDNSGDVEAHPIDEGGVDTDTIAWANGTAAEQLDDKVGETSDSRTIITYQDTGDNTSAGTPFQWSDLLAAQQTELNDGDTRGQDRLNWLRGWSEHEGDLQADGSGGFREREEGKYLGDIVHSAPVFVGAPPFFGRNNPPYPTGDTDLYPEFKQDNSDRKEMLYVGANDGMLHGFNANTGEEEFAYIPNAVFDGLAELPDPAYQHRYYVDSTPAVNDAFIDANSSGSRDWTTVLVGGLGAGGRGLYALDITDPPSAATQDARETEMADKVMWEFTAADDNDLGYTFGEPLIAISNHEDGDGEHKWVALLGNGYNSETGNAALFALDLSGGLDGDWGASDYKKIDANAAPPAADDPKNGIGGFRGVDSNKDGAVDLVYAGDLQGNLHRFSLSDASMGSWGYDGVLFDAAYSGDGTAQPITTAPVVIQHPDSGLLVIFGTGSWMTEEDKTTDDIQSIYGVWDPTPTGELSGPVTTASLTEQEFINQTSREHGFVVRTLSNNAVDYSAQGNNISNQDRGWYIDLDMPPAGSADDGSKANAQFPGERLVRRLQLRGGLVFGNTVIPKPTVDPDGDGTEEEQLCQLGAGGFELAFDPLTGGPGDKVIFDLSEDENFTDADNVGDTEGVEYIVTGRRFDDATPADSSFIGSRRVTQTSDKELHETETNTEPDVDEGRHSWREIGF